MAEQAVSPLPDKAATTRKRLTPGSKRAGVLRELLARGERGLNRFEAEKAPCFDHTLPSTIAELCSDFGLRIPRRLEAVPGHRGKPTEVSRYFLSLEDRAKVPELLGEAPSSSSNSAAIEFERRARAERAARGQQ